MASAADNSMLSKGLPLGNPYETLNALEKKYSPLWLTEDHSGAPGLAKGVHVASECFLVPSSAGHLCAVLNLYNCTC